MVYFLINPCYVKQYTSMPYTHGLCVAGGEGGKERVKKGEKEGGEEKEGRERGRNEDLEECSAIMNSSEQWSWK